MADLIPSWSWVSLVFLGSFHGVNPAMGWLFAVALGLQERSTRAVVGALAPIALGHAISIGVVVVAVWALGSFLPQEALMLAGGAAMVGFAAYKVLTRFRHRAWVGMRVSSRDLVAWSFLMATAHGAGLMLLPPLLALRSSSVPSAVAHEGHHAHHMPTTAGSGGECFAVSLLAVGVHTAALFAVMGVIAMVVYKRVGVDVLRRAWVNIDLLWIGTLAIAGTVTLGLGTWSLVS
jgi:hypothetical protein